MDKEGDASGNTRFIDPLKLIAYEFKNYNYFGVPSNTYNYFLITNLYQSTADFPMHNGILNLIIWFGIFGFIHLYCLIKKLNNSTEYILIFLVGFQNGNFYSYEKVFTIIYLIFFYRAISYAETPKLSRAQIK